MTSLPTPAAPATPDTALHAVPRGAVSALDELACLWFELVKANASHNHPHLYGPSPVQVAVLRALAAAGGESWAGQLGRDTGRDPNNLRRWTIPALATIGVVDYGDEEPRARGGVPARLVHLTRAGRRIVELLPAVADVDENEAA